MFANIENKKILVLAPHTDDAELGMGGSISKFVAKNEIHIAAFSACRKSVISGLPDGILVDEIQESSKKLGINESNLHLFEFEVRSFNFHRQEILELLIELRKRINPEIVFIPSLQDVHQDHNVIATEAVRAFKNATILSYELPWNNFNFSNTCFIELTEEELNRKLAALSSYNSQKHRNYFSPSYTKSLAISRGVQVNLQYAECFEIIRMIL